MKKEDRGLFSVLKSPAPRDRKISRRFFTGFKRAKALSNYWRYFALAGKAIYFAFAKCDIPRYARCEMIFVLSLARSAYRIEDISPELSSDIARSKNEYRCGALRRTAGGYSPHQSTSLPASPRRGSLRNYTQNGATPGSYRAWHFILTLSSFSLKSKNNDQSR